MLQISVVRDDHRVYAWDPDGNVLVTHDPALAAEAQRALRAAADDLDPFLPGIPGEPLEEYLTAGMPRLGQIMLGEPGVVGVSVAPPATPEELEEWKRIVGPVSIPVNIP